MSQPEPPNTPSTEPTAEHASVAENAAMHEAHEGLGEEPPARPRLDPTRYGDWELNGKCVDF